LLQDGRVCFCKRRLLHQNRKTETSMLGCALRRLQGSVTPKLRKFRRNRNSGMSVFWSFSRLGATPELRNTGTPEIPVTAEFRFRRNAQPSLHGKPLCNCGIRPPKTAHSRGLRASGLSGSAHKPSKPGKLNKPSKPSKPSKPGKPTKTNSAIGIGI